MRRLQTLSVQSLTITWQYVGRTLRYIPVTFRGAAPVAEKARQSRNYIIVASLLLNLAAGFYVIPRFIVFAVRPHLYMQVTRDKASVIIMGDSRAQQGDWAKGLERDEVANIGEGNTTTKEWVSRAETVKAKVAVIQLGINDFRHGVSIDTVYARFNHIIAALQSNGVEPIVTSVIPVWRDIFQDSIPVHVLNERIATLNRRLAVTCKAGNIVFVDLDGLRTGKELNLKYTYDGIHLNAEGYEVMCGMVRKSETIKNAALAHRFVLSDIFARVF